jgi:two-component system chemotaxis response regulator CheB
MMTSVAETFHALTLGVIMTGMGADGAKGMQVIKREGGFNLGQDEAGCTVYGMPRSAAEAKVLHRVVPLMQIPEQIMQITHYKKRAEHASAT